MGGEDWEAWTDLLLAEGPDGSGVPESGLFLHRARGDLADLQERNHWQGEGTLGELGRRDHREDEACGLRGCFSFP